MTFKKGEISNPNGRPKGSLNRTTRLKHAFFDGIELAAKAAGFEGSAEYVAEVLKSPLDRVAILKIGATLIPKELKAEVTERVVISMGPDGDCKEDGDG